MSAKETYFDQLTNLIQLNLNGCFLNSIDFKILKHFVHLETINLSRNTIKSIDWNLFRKNIKLKSINLSSNLIISIHKHTFQHLRDLEVLDLSYNCISKLSKSWLYSDNLKQLQLNNNLIDEVKQTAFYQLPNLTHLDLNNNKIQRLENRLFFKSLQLQSLSLNNNQINDLNIYHLLSLHQLQQLYMRDNSLSLILSKSVFFNNRQLTDLDLSGNHVSIIDPNMFATCENLKFLHLIICGQLEIRTIESLTQLLVLELYLSTRDRFFMSKKFWRLFKNKPQLMMLKLIFGDSVITEMDDIDVNNKCYLKHLKNLEYLHIEFQVPAATYFEINFENEFKRLPKLKTLILKTLNDCIVKGRYDFPFFETKNLLYLDLSGIKNSIIIEIFQNFQLLEYLNLSFSEVNFIYDQAFQYSFNLKHLDLQFSKLQAISAQLFLSTTKLEILNCANCRLNVIEDYAFVNLRLLHSLDLRNNLLTTISNKTFAGLSENTIIY